jgi:hypothetical protein
MCQLILTADHLVPACFGWGQIAAAKIMHVNRHGDVKMWDQHTRDLLDLVVLERTAESKLNRRIDKSGWLQLTRLGSVSSLLFPVRAHVKH